MHALLYSVSPTLKQATADPRCHQELLDTHGQVWVSLLWGHCSFLLGPGAHKFLFMLSKSLFPQSYASSGGSMMGLMVTPSKRAYATHSVTQVFCSQSPCPCGRSLLTCASAGDTQILKGRSGSVSVGSSGLHKALFEPSEHLWQL